MKNSNDIESIFDEVLIPTINRCGIKKNSDFKDKFIQLSRGVYFANDKRSKTKSEINKILGSNIKEVKQYSQY